VSVFPHSHEAFLELLKGQDAAERCFSFALLKIVDLLGTFQITESSLHFQIKPREGVGPRQVTQRVGLTIRSQIICLHSSLTTTSILAKDAQDVGI
jgi:hypothetical protein